MIKYKQYYQSMWEENTRLFSTFKQIHDTFAKDRKSDKSLFDSVGKEVTDIIHVWEQRLCQTMERGSNGVYSSKLSEKFQALVKEDFPFIELVGVQILHV